jgi:hypothetical protein
MYNYVSEQVGLIDIEEYRLVWVLTIHKQTSKGKLYEAL